MIVDALVGHGLSVYHTGHCCCVFRSRTRDMMFRFMHRHFLLPLCPGHAVQRTDFGDMGPMCIVFVLSAAAVVRL